jgi:hypothetical protein
MRAQKAADMGAMSRGPSHARTWVVPGHGWWRARRVRRGGTTVAVRARHRLLPWLSITVDTGDLRAGAEAVARELNRRAAGGQWLSRSGG